MTVCNVLDRRDDNQVSFLIRNWAFWVILPDKKQSRQFAHNAPIYGNVDIILVLWIPTKTVHFHFFIASLL